MPTRKLTGSQRRALVRAQRGNVRTVDFKAGKLDRKAQALAFRQAVSRPKRRILHALTLNWGLLQRAAVKPNAAPKDPIYVYTRAKLDRGTMLVSLKPVGALQIAWPKLGSDFVKLAADPAGNIYWFSENHGGRKAEERTLGDFEVLPRETPVYEFLISVQALDKLRPKRERPARLRRPRK